MNIWKSIAQAIWDEVEPWLAAKWVEVKPELFQWLKDQFHEWMPILIASAGKATLEVGTKIAVAAADKATDVAVNVEDKTTDMIPGTLDDQILDPMFQNVMGWVDDVFKGMLPKP